MNLSSEQITKMLHAWGEGNTSALEQLLPLIYDELHRLASAYLRGERRSHTLQTTALHQRSVSAVGRMGKRRVENRAHFLGLAAQMMRRDLVDFARTRHYAKRGGDAQQVELEAAKLAAPHRRNKRNSSTFRERLGEMALSFSEALEITIQIAHALGT